LKIKKHKGKSQTDFTFRDDNDGGVQQGFISYIKAGSRKLRKHNFLSSV
jgi:hypothetical protein